MIIEDIGKGYRFCVPIPFESSETEVCFLQRASDCLEAFFEEYTEIPKKDREELNPIRKPFWGEEGLEKLKGEISAWDFEDFRLRGMPNCNVDFYVGTPKDNYGQIGIDILTNANDPDQEPKVDFLKKLWTEFDYTF